MFYVVLFVLVTIIFLKLYQILGRVEFSSPMADMTDILEPQSNPKQIIKPQWSMLKKLDSSLSEKNVIHDFLHIFQQIHLAFYSASLKSVEQCLSQNVRDVLEKAFLERGKNRYNYKFLGEPICQIKQITIEDSTCTMDAEFKSHQIVQIENETGQIVENPHAIEEEVTDYWVLQRNFSQNPSFWKIVQMA